MQFHFSTMISGNKAEPARVKINQTSEKPHQSAHLCGHTFPEKLFTLYFNIEVNYCHNTIHITLISHPGGVFMTARKMYSNKKNMDLI